ncbi:proton-coupled amino acid transporter-like protein CG1139 [Diaphorina citri]|uniref:Proton-coupled amino acid transporter-like protein CG1139 n=1 Tax=Diaphorina citri TaxID=121845 RepID=A0A3Q0JLZ2_DIACI|nr:proton-coupled amino acid transporter-like protein CG1139 [Diaphorina citri]
MTRRRISRALTTSSLSRIYLKDVRNIHLSNEQFTLFHRNWETYIHFIKGSIGTGCLAMPSGFKSVGYLPGLFFGVFTGALTMMTLHLLMQIKYDVSKKMKYHVVQFPDVCELVMMEGPPSLYVYSPVPRGLRCPLNDSEEDLQSSDHIIPVPPSLRWLAKPLP